jgi:hypothetical protein
MRAAVVLAGVVWVVCGAVIGVSPPLSETGRGSGSPFVGWLVCGFGVFVVVSGVRNRSISGRPRHSRGREASRANELRLFGAAAITTVGGVGSVWWGIASGGAAHTAFGVIALSMVVLIAPHLLDAVRHRIARTQESPTDDDSGVGAP